MNKCLLCLLIGISIWQSVFAQSITSGGDTLDAQNTGENPTNAITGEVLIPTIKEPTIGLTIETNEIGELVAITNQAVVLSPKTVQRITPEVRITDIGATGSHPGIGHSIEVDGNLNRSDSVVLHLPSTGEGKVSLQGHAIGIGVIDGSGNQVWLGKIKDCSGEIDKEHRNVIRWADAFTGIRADVLLIYGATYVEQLVVLKENPVLPPEINQSTARLFVMSEFFQTPEPRRERRTVKLRVDPDLERQHGTLAAEDEILDWGWMRMAEGRAFVWQKSDSTPVRSAVSTSKSWQKDGNRVFLVESADYLSLKPSLASLASIDSSNKHQYLAQNTPDPMPSSKQRQSLRLANLDLMEGGVVLDYLLVNSALINVNFASTNKVGAAVVGSSGDYWNSYVHPYATNVIVTNLAWNTGTIPSPVSLRVENAPGQWGFTTTDPMYGSYIYPHNGGHIYCNGVGKAI